MASVRRRLAGVRLDVTWASPVSDGATRGDSLGSIEQHVNLWGRRKAGRKGGGAENHRARAKRGPACQVLRKTGSY